MPIEVVVAPGTHRREDPLTGNSVLIVPGRKLVRKITLSDAVAYKCLPKHSDNCPFCPGSEEKTPQERARIVLGPDGVWAARSVDNLYPFFCNMGIDGLKNELSEPLRGFVRNAGGFHEVIVDSPWHNACYSCMSPEEIAPVFLAMAQRSRQLEEDDPRLKVFFPFKNYGVEASKDHSHWQLTGIRFVPEHIRRRIQRIAAWRKRRDECLVCWLQEQGRAAGRVVAQTEHFVAFIPFAPSVSFAVRMVPKEHTQDFSDHLGDQAIALDFASLVGEVMKKVRTVLQADIGEEDKEMGGDPHHFFCLYTAPLTKSRNMFHWHLELLPQTTMRAGFEEGTGLRIISAVPEDVAEALRAV